MVLAGRPGQSFETLVVLGIDALQLLVLNEEFLVSASHQLALITSLPFVHTARRYYRLNGLVRPLEWGSCRESAAFSEIGQTWSFRGSKSRNKVSVGEPAEGSLTNVVCMGGWWREGGLCSCCVSGICPTDAATPTPTPTL